LFGNKNFEEEEEDQCIHLGRKRNLHINIPLLSLNISKNPIFLVQLSRDESSGV
jgi:hypothetical protein